MSPDQLRELASAGGRAAHDKGVWHSFTRDEARKAGRLGGAAVSRDREHMSRIGRIGGTAKKTRQAEDLAHDWPTTQEIGRLITGDEP